jgi:membrane protein implicated in regulation of membrane protease activity
MDWSAVTLWWIAAGALVALELVSGTFYLLMLALGCVAGALAAHAGASGTVQVVAAALLGGGATVAWHLKRSRQPTSAPSDTNRDVQQDVGRTLQVPAWGADGSARVSYRGAAWSVRFAGDGAPAPGEHVIVAVDGNLLRVQRASN